MSEDKPYSDIGVRGDAVARPMTIGETRVRLSFNPGQNDLVTEIKRHSAAIIDLVQAQMGKSSEHNRCLSLAMTHYEDAAMWAVKGVTG